MKRTYTAILLLMIYLILLATTSSAQEIKVDVFNFQPFYIAEEGQEPSGIFVDYLKVALERCNLSYVIKGYPPKRVYNNLAEGKSDIFLGVKGVPELEGNVLYSDQKITEIDLRIYARQDTPILKTKEELKGNKIITIRGYSYGGFIKYLEDPANSIKIDASNSHELAFKMLQGKRADYLLDYSAPAETTLKSVKIPGIQNHSISRLDVVVIVSKQAPDAESLLNRLEQAFVDLKKEGKIN